MFSRSKLKQILLKHQKQMSLQRLQTFHAHRKASVSPSASTITTSTAYVVSSSVSVDRKIWKEQCMNNLSSEHVLGTTDDDKELLTQHLRQKQGSNLQREQQEPEEVGELYLNDFNYIATKKTAETTITSTNNCSDDNDVNSSNRNSSKNKSADFNEMDTFHYAVSPILFIGQCFAVMPVCGILQLNPYRLRFSHKSAAFIWTLVFLICSSIITLSMLKHRIKIGVNAKNFVGVVFFANVQSACLLFISLAKRWPHIMRYWFRVELIFTRPPYEKPKRSLAKRVHLAAILILLLSFLEHCMSVADAVISYTWKTHQCAAGTNQSGITTFTDFMPKNYDYVYTLLPENFFVGVFILVTNFICTFIWNYMDLFIMMISKGIAYRFEQITARINKLADKEVPESVFIELRENYVRLCELLEHIDENLSGIILLSCMNNLYFVCYQLLNIFNNLRLAINYIYFWFSLLYLVGRTAFVFLSAASINDEAKGALSVLRRVSSKTWCVEVERLIFQMATQTVALSGKKFYFLTRRLLFGMAGTIVTYELVLLQFDEPNRSKGLTDLCA